MESSKQQEFNVTEESHDILLSPTNTSDKMPLRYSFPNVIQPVNTHETAAMSFNSVMKNDLESCADQKSISLPLHLNN
jgi:hypothetical protein